MNNTWKNLFRPRKAETELNAEMRDHLERQINENLRRGMTPEIARRQALLSLGGVEQVKEECRDERPARIMADLWRDIAAIAVIALVFLILSLILLRKQEA